MSEGARAKGCLAEAAGQADEAVPLTEGDVALLRAARERGRLYASDNEGKWKRVLDLGLLEAVPEPQVDWFGGWLRLTARGAALLDRLDAVVP